jgi:hypothetical protein
MWHIHESEDQMTNDVVAKAFDRCTQRWIAAAALVHSAVER